jgi:type IV pilus assembly protein PilN
VILINLLPHREAAKKLRKDHFNVALVASLLAGAALAVLIYLGFQAAISSQQSVNRILKSEIGKLDVQIKEIANIEAEIAALTARQRAVEQLQSDRNTPVNLLTELVTMLPDGVYINSMSQAGAVVNISGVAQSQERISELLRNINTKGIWLTKPELIVITAGSAALSARDTRRVANFSMRMTLVSASAPTSAASAPASAAKAPAGK